ncbi:hypothetical protein EVA_18589 [gut metagenome]|uniref:Uncharacterized protein n=1 Tax=gut metagenome TaxID=749906 RepID=J9G137_9ZZZZ
MQSNLAGSFYGNGMDVSANCNNQSAVLCLVLQTRSKTDGCFSKKVVSSGIA